MAKNKCTYKMHKRFDYSHMSIIIPNMPRCNINKANSHFAKLSKEYEELQKAINVGSTGNFDREFVIAEDKHN